MHVASNAEDQYARIAGLYDHVPAYRDRGDIAFFTDAATRARGEVLELGCGTGRVLVPIARAGCRITGLDASPSMLRVCSAHLEREPSGVRERVTLTEGDMRSFSLGRTFSLITTPFRSFQHLLTVEEQLATLRAIREHLSADGTFILDVFNPSLDALANRPMGEEFPDTAPYEMADGRRFERRGRIRSHDRTRQINEVELIYYLTDTSGRVEQFVHSFAMRYFFRYEAEHLLARAGFAVQQVFGGYRNEPFGSTYPGELIVVAKRS